MRTLVNSLSPLLRCIYNCSLAIAPHLKFVFLITLYSLAVQTFEIATRSGHGQNEMKKSFKSERRTSSRPLILLARALKGRKVKKMVGGIEDYIESQQEIMEPQHYFIPPPPQAPMTAIQQQQLQPQVTTSGGGKMKGAGKRVARPSPLSIAGPSSSMASAASSIISNSAACAGITQQPPPTPFSDTTHLPPLRELPSAVVSSVGLDSKPGEESQYVFQLGERNDRQVLVFSNGVLICSKSDQMKFVEIDLNRYVTYSFYQTITHLFSIVD